MLMNPAPLDPPKKLIHDFWNEHPCQTGSSQEAKYSKAYFDQLERERYQIEPEIISFADFNRYQGKKILEVGVGTGIDFARWIRSGAIAYGIDLTEEAIERTERLLESEGLKAAELKVADCEAISYPDSTFDLVYSWGVIHHTPDTQKAVSEIVRVCRPGGICKIMVYHKNSLAAFYHWIRHAFLKGKPWKSISECLGEHLESPGTKAFTKMEVLKMLNALPVEDIRIKTWLTYYDRLGYCGKFIRIIVALFLKIFGGDSMGWFLTAEFNKR